MDFSVKLKVFKRAQATFDEAVKMWQSGSGVLPKDIVRDSVIKRFTYTYELLRQVLKEYAERECGRRLGSFRLVASHSYKIGFISAQERNQLIEMIKDRRKLADECGNEFAQMLVENVVGHCALILELAARLDGGLSESSAK